MGMCVCGGAVLSCSFGAVPGVLMVTPENKTISVMPIATIMDYVPVKNIMSFGMCNSIANPTVSAATTAAAGILTPMPCLPGVTAPWAPGSPGVLIGNKPALNQNSRAACLWGGIIQITNPGVTNIQIP